LLLEFLQRFNVQPYDCLHELLAAHSIPEDDLHIDTPLPTEAFCPTNRRLGHLRQYQVPFLVDMAKPYLRLLEAAMCLDHPQIIDLALNNFLHAINILTVIDANNDKSISATFKHKAKLLRACAHHTLAKTGGADPSLRVTHLTTIVQDIPLLYDALIPQAQASCSKSDSEQHARRTRRAAMRKLNVGRISKAVRTLTQKPAAHIKHDKALCAKIEELYPRASAEEMQRLTSSAADGDDHSQQVTDSIIKPLLTMLRKDDCPGIAGLNGTLLHYILQAFPPAEKIVCRLVKRIAVGDMPASLTQ
jgi:hypothetical protein